MTSLIYVTRSCTVDRKMCKLRQEGKKNELKNPQTNRKGPRERGWGGGGGRKRETGGRKGGEGGKAGEGFSTCFTAVFQIYKKDRNQLNL